MKINDLLEKLEGIQTISTVMALLGTTEEKAIYYLYRLRKRGYVRTKRLSNNARVYNISFKNRLKGISYYEILNAHSPLKLTESSDYQIYGIQPSLEETLIFAIKTKSVRTILASLALFKQLNNWNELYRLAKINRIERQVGALYDLARKFMRTRRMSKKFRNNSLPKRNYSYGSIIEGLRSRDFHDIEKVWRIHIPFNKQDMEDYL